jgi:nitrite reductase/ring-hydroxylating ferredoxin subunit
MMQTSEWIEVANVNEISPGKMKHVEVDGKEIMIANVDGKFYAINDRCGHMNARLSSGVLKGNIVTCPQHAAQFDVTTGKKQSEPRLGGNIPDMDKLPPSFLRTIEHSGKIMAEIKTYDQRTYQLSVDEKTIRIKLT